MAGVIKGVLKEELKNSKQMKRAYERAIEKLPPGNVTIKKIRGNFYAYKVEREGEKVKFEYKGKASEEAWKKHHDAKEARVKYRSLLSQSKKQIRYLKGALRGKEAI